MSLMFCEVVRVDQKVVEVDNEELVEEFAEGVIHVMLKRTRSVAEAEGHYCILEQPISAPEAGLLLLSRGATEPIVAVSHVELREIFRTADAIEQFADKGSR